MKRVLLLLAVGFLLGGGTSAPAFAQDAIKGKSIFEGNCASCHSIQDQVVGPALKDVDKRYEESWIINFVNNSGKMVAAGDKHAVEVFEKFGKIPMPSFESSLSDQDITDLLAYVKQESAAPAPAPPVAVVPSPEGKEKVVVQSPSFSLKSLEPTTMMVVIVVGFLLLLVLTFLMITFAQALPLLAHLYDKPSLKNTVMARFLGLLRGDTTTLVGKHDGEVMEGHSYDGIHELDNDLPPWWKYSFYASIVFAVVYLLYYHVLGGELQMAEYESEVKEAAVLSAALGTGNVNEKTDYQLITDVAQIEAGQAAYIQNCAACHGQKGEGVVGPNLADDYWLHGSDVNGIYKTIKHGVTSKGMVAWQGKLSHEQMLQITSYIITMKGTNPPNGKEPQGEKVK